MLALTPRAACCPRRCTSRWRCVRAVNPEQVVAFLVFALVGAGTPGPANVLLAATGAQVGVLRGVPCLLGVAIGTAVALQWVNPKSWLVSTSAAGTYLSSESGGAFAQSATFGLLFVVAALPARAVWLAFGSIMRRVLTTPRASRVFNLCMGALLAGSVALILV